MMNFLREVLGEVPLVPRAPSFEVRSNARIRATVPLVIVALIVPRILFHELLFHEDVFLQRENFHASPHFSVRLDKLA